jgi:hypothetical protein
MIISPRYFSALLLILACFIRLVYFYQFQGNPFSCHLPELWDQTLYHKGAQAFIEGDPFARAPGEPNQQSPFYQYFLGIVYFFFGVELTAAWIIQLILGVVSTFLVYAIAGRYINPKDLLSWQPLCSRFTEAIGFMNVPFTVPP